MKTKVILYICEGGSFCANNQCVATGVSSFAELKETPLVEKEGRGKPVISNYPDIFFSKSHSGFVCACAFCKGVRIGLDIESREGKAAHHSRVAKRFFSAAEQKYMLDAPSVVSPFFSLWVRKEAIIKESGEGIASLAKTHLSGSGFDKFKGKTIIDLKSFPRFKNRGDFYGAICLDGENREIDLEVIEGK